MGLPTGTVTFVFTDIEGSTRLWDQHPKAMAEALATHDRILSDITTAAGGYVFSQAGDGWGIAFSSATAAITAALDIRQSLEGALWPDETGPLKARIGMHAGTASERDGDYFGTTVNRAARIAAVANGGQIFTSDTVKTLIADADAPTWQFRDLGEHRLRDLVRPERLWQVDRIGEHVPLAALTEHASKGNLPRRRGSVVGRDAEQAEIVAAIGTTPLITLVGVGGVGKTTLAVAAAATAQDAFSGGGWFVDLTATSDPDLVAGAIAGAVRITPRPDMDDTGSLIDGLLAESRLVVIDNAEHLVEVVADLVDTIVASVPDVCLLVTSREPLGIHGERVLRIGPLEVSPVAGHSPATDLFIERAKAAAPDLDDSAFAVETIAAICARLDGLPLAIELAAAQSEVMTPDEVLHALEGDRFDMHSMSRSTTQRHRSLTDLVAWSYELLEPDHRIVFERMSVFRGGCTREAAIAVCSDSSVTESAVRAAVSNLVRKSMVVTQRTAGTTRLSMLETLRQFSSDRLDKAEDRELVRERHARWYAERSAESRDMSMGPQEAEFLSAAISDLDNIQAASDWACENGQFDLLRDIGAGLPYLVGSRMRPGLTAWIREAIGKIPEDDDARLSYALALVGTTLFGGDIAEASALYADLTSGVTDVDRRSAIQRYVEHVSRFFLGDLEFVLEDGETAIDDLASRGLIREASAVGTDYALTLFYSGDNERASAVAADVLRLATDLGVPSLLAWALYVQGEILGESDPDRAIELLEESIENGVTVGNEFVVGISLTALASIAGRTGKVAYALDAMQRCVRLWRTAGNRPQMWTAVRNLVEILHTIGRDSEALTLHHAVEADAEHAPALFGPFGDHYRSIVSEVQASLEPDMVSQAKRHGSTMNYATTASYAIGVIDDSVQGIESV
jgi:predicted ATPase/class 3 adenylate cyclase